MMAADILKFICAHRGAVNTEDLIYNLGLGDSTNDMILNQDKFASCCPFGQPKVVARTRLRLCRDKECQGSCSGLHLCKNFLFSGSCQFQSRRGCRFSHELNSDHNEAILREHELESLSRAELCTLLLQSDDQLLPAVCYDYNNGDGAFGRCQAGNGCKRLHICERYLNSDCRCHRNHDFNAPQPLKALHDKGVPVELISSLKAAYANKQALKYHDNRSSRGNHGDRGNRGNRHFRGGYRGHRGFRGNLGSRQQQERTHSTSDILAAMALYGDGGPNEGAVEQEQFESSADASSNRGKSRSNPSATARGRGGNRGKPLQRTRSTGNIAAAINVLELVDFDGPSKGICDQQQLMSPSSEDGAGGQSAKQKRNPNQVSVAARGRGGSRGGYQQLQPTRISGGGDQGANSSDGLKQQERQRPVRDKTEICMYFIKGYCKHEERCFKAHDKMPYRWEVREGDQWTPIPDNETVEKDYCDPKNTYSSSSPPVHFDTMTCGPNKVRRLSTANSVLEPTFIHTTEWVWYWEDESGKWNMYASADDGHKAADVDSIKLEQKFLDNDKDVVEFRAGSQSYSLSFKDMIQTNKQYSTKRVVRRRPRFFSAADVKARRVRKPTAPHLALPDHWDKTQIPQTGYKRVLLQRSSKEFKEIEALFCETMKGFDIVKIERIQNKYLWEAFQLQQAHMKNSNGGRDVKEKKLFHGTDNKYVDVICQTNFDWRLCGTHGTAYGKGSYFARDAKYSNSYTSDSDVKSMFVARLLVGEYTKGSSDFRRPPSKDGGDVNFFDSCVDNVLNPSIYVVFEKHQIYPEYLLEYQRSTAGLFAAASVPVPKPVPAPKTTPQQYASFYKPSASSYQSSLSSYRASTSSYQPTVSTYQPTAPAYQPSASSYQPTASSYQPTASSYQPSASSYQSSVSSYQSSLSSYRANTSSHQPSSKRSESTCVIA